MGEALEKEIENCRGAGFTATTMGEVLPPFENYVRIDKTVSDAWGIPALHIHTRYTSNEFNMAEDAVNTLEELCHGADGKYWPRAIKCSRPATAFTNWGLTAWATIQKPACSTNGIRVMMSRIYSWLMAVAS